MPELTIRKLLEQIHNGQIRIPAFQRGFVWNEKPDMVAFFMDSLYKGYPFGTLLLWRTRQSLKVERKLGPFDLPPPDTDYPIDYVLDGQQRITSIFGVFQTDIPEPEPAPWTHIYFDYKASPSAQESQFIVLDPAAADRSRHFPLKCLFNTVGYRQATEGLPDDAIQKIDEMQSRFKEAQLPVQMITTEDKATVAIVFERVNRRGVPLDTLQLLAAWTWSVEFDLTQRFKGLTEELQPFGFEEVGEDTNLLLRCAAAIIAGDASPETLLNLNGASVRERFTEVLNGVKGAIDFLRTNLKVESLQNLPFHTILVPLSVFFSVPGNQIATYMDAQRQILVRWFWRTCFSRRYSSGVLRSLKTDIEEAAKLKSGAHSNLDSFTTTVTPDFFESNTFTIDTVNTKTMILMLAQRNPLSFVSGAPVDLANVLRAGNRNEFHHVFPRAFLKSRGFSTDNINPLANFCFLSSADNKILGGEAPSIYRAKMPTSVSDILQRAFCPESLLFRDDYLAFRSERARLLAKYANDLMK
ncbi:DUF262 domain-containing protein [Pyxidicoccus caerfyrddinensis]|uniref:DUF262 domain-containing protein n=1 Tax=Pyxidicoccus caerfyrddinensis TaxID=2709663 RepID=UPI0013DB2D58|nr:DUF262 domain-containing protein [Pyxidicoccus caerfyrddinensis]